MPDAGLLEELKAILRRDLKLGAETPIPNESPLIGGEMDLDSLDVLLIVSSVEKHFGIKIPNEAVGRTVFENVSTLGQYIEDNREALAVARAGSSSKEGESDWLSRLPHGPEFLFLSKVNEVLPGHSAKGEWSVSGAESFFAGHFPGRPIVPGVLIIEGLAQLAGLAAADVKGTGAGVLAHVDVKFESAVVPPARIDLVAIVARAIGPLRMCELTASVSGKTIARGSAALRIE